MVTSFKQTLISTMTKSILEPHNISRFLELTKVISTWSKDPSTKVGSVLISLDGKTASTGYNGLPYSLDDELIHDRDFKLENVIHAEMNAIANRYLFNEPCILFVSKPICTDCVKLVTAHRFIKGVCWLNDIEFAQRWNVNKSVEMLERHFKSKLVTTPEYSYISKATDK